MNILITDDHANVRRGLRELLADAFSGARFFEAGNGDEVLVQLAVSQPDVLLLDINMPGRSGFEVLKDVKQMPEGRSGRICQQEQRFGRTGSGGQEDTELRCKSGTEPDWIIVTA
jgi:DNA-binding NarL/FixJ family response regulator